MQEKIKKKGFVRTTIYISEDLHNNAKLMAVLTGKPVSQIIRVALNEKLAEIKEQHKKSETGKIISFKKGNSSDE